MRRAARGRTVGILLALAVAGCATTPVAPPRGPVESWVTVADRGWHTDLCIPVADATGALAPVATGFRGATVLCFGFGARVYYTSRQAGPGEAIASLFPGPAALLLTVLRASPAAAFGADHVVRLGITRAGAARLADFIDRSLQHDTNGAPLRLRPGPYPGSVFYAATGTYDAFRTCNTWSADGLHAAGLPVRGDVIFAGQVMAEARRVATAAR